MSADQTPEDDRPGCPGCGRPLTDPIYVIHGESLCEDCCLAALTRPKRKTHWQYISSIKGEYLQPAVLEKEKQQPISTSPTTRTSNIP